MLKMFFALVLFSTGFNTSFADDRPTLHGPHGVAATLGFAPGGVTLSGSYEYLMDGSLGAGGYIRMFPKETDIRNSAPGLLILGGAVSHHFYKKNWDLSITPGFGIINIDAVAGDDVTTLGPSLGFGLAYQLTGIWAIGFENNRYWVWFNNDYVGELRDDMSIKVRATF